MDFGLASDKDEALVARFKITKYPTLVVHRTERKLEVYKGKLEFEPMFQWLNAFSETFVKGGGYGHDSGKAENATPWLVEVIPQVTKASHKDVCFKGDRGLCMIYLKEGELAPSEEKMLEEMSKKYSVKTDRAPAMQWLWMNLSRETGFKDLFRLTKLPSLVVVNPRKRIRYVAIDAEETANPDSIKKLVDKIMGGDARFTNVKSLPDFYKGDGDGDVAAEKDKPATATDGKKGKSGKEL
eukprot:Filipodium_phascolosomae@DN775_c0_g1_i1.p1